MKGFLKSLLASFVGTILALGLCIFVFFGFIAALISFGSNDSTPKVPSSVILKISLSQSLQDRENKENLYDIINTSSMTQESLTLLNAVKAVETAATDPAVKFIYIDASNVGMSLTAMEELRGALKKVKEAGKGIIAYSSSLGQGSYYIASIADKIYVNEQSMPEFVGISSNILFFKDLLDRLGVNVQLIRHGKFKAAGEQFTKSSLTAENREQNEVMLNSIWDSWMEEICESREISADRFNFLVNNLKLGTVESLIENGLIDEAVTEQELSDILCTLFSVEKEKDLKFITLGKYAKARLTPNIKAKDKIAVLYATGEIMEEGTGASSKPLTSEIKKIREDSTIKAVIFRVNSPGGDAMAAEYINNQIQLLREKKPVIVSFGDYAASGGYWISAKSDKIFTNKTTITGSIGVFSIIFSTGDAVKKNLKINMETVSTHDHSDMMLGVRPLNTPEIEFMQSHIENIYSQFTGLVAEGRSLSKEYVDSIGQGRVWTGKMAQQIKLADEIGGISDAINYAAMITGLSDYRIVEYPKSKSSVDALLEILGDGSEEFAALTDPISLVEKYYESITESNDLNVVARLPFIYQIRK